MATVHPENHNVMIGGGQQRPANIPRHRDSSCTRKKRSVVSVVILSLVFAGIVCAIVIPLVLNANCAKSDDPPASTTTTTSWSSMTGTTENSSETNTSLTSIKPTTTKTQRSSTKGTDMNTTDEDDNETDPSIVVHTWTVPNSNGSTRTNPTETHETSNLTTTDKSSIMLSTQSTSTRSRLDRIQVNHFNDTIVGVYNTRAGGFIGGFYNNSGGETAKYAMDGSLQTKYFNPSGNSLANQGINTGFIVIPLTPQYTVPCALRFGTGNDEPERDPFTVTLEGSNDTDIVQLNSNSTWTLIYDGSTGINNTEILNRSTYASEQRFDNGHAFISYRLLVTSKRNNSTAVQYSEAEIYSCL